jgi:hypothetical protein
VIQDQIPSAGIYNLNSGLYCLGLSGQIICAPLSCPVAVIDLGTVVWNRNTENIADWVSNFTLAPFYTWNPYISLDHVTHGTVVCVG